jgi:hypothetical protein
MRIVDTVPKDSLHKLILLDLGGLFAIQEQAINRQPDEVLEHFTRDDAMFFWGRACVANFVSLTHNFPDAEALADRRVKSIFFED